MQQLSIILAAFFFFLFLSSRVALFYGTLILSIVIVALHLHYFYWIFAQQTVSLTAEVPRVAMFALSKI